jgi:RNase P subunit RPR2
MKCPKCNSILRKVGVKVAHAKNQAISHQCPKCDYFNFEPASAKMVSREVRLSDSGKNI